MLAIGLLIYYHIIVVQNVQVRLKGSWPEIMIILIKVSDIHPQARLPVSYLPHSNIFNYPVTVCERIYFLLLLDISQQYLL